MRENCVYSWCTWCHRSSYLSMFIWSTSVHQLCAIHIQVLALPGSKFLNFCQKRDHKGQVVQSTIGLMRDYVTFSKFITNPRVRNIFSNFHCLRVVFTWAFFSSLLLWELFHDKMYILHFQSEAWWWFLLVWCHHTWGLFFLIPNK